MLLVMTVYLQNAYIPKKMNSKVWVEGNEHLLGTRNDCDEYYKNW